VQIFDFPVIAAGEVAVISTRDVLFSDGGGSSTAAGREAILQEAMQSLHLKSAGADDDADNDDAAQAAAAADDALLDDALRALDSRSSGCSDLD
jgi:hypothetical protein